MTARKTTLIHNTTKIYPQTTDDMVFIEGDADNRTVRDFISETEAQFTKLGQQVIYDVSANNGGTAFASLSALLSDENLSTLIPVAVRCGGMSIRFVQTSDNKYVQYMLMTDYWNTLEQNWEKINLEVELEHLEQEMNRHNFECADFIDHEVVNNGVPSAGTNFYHTIPMRVLNALLIKNVSKTPLNFEFYTSDVISSETFIENNTTGVVPQFAKYFLINFYESGHVLPSVVTFDTEDYSDQMVNRLLELLREYVSIPKSDIIQKSTIDVSGNIVSAGAKFYRTDKILCAWMNKVSTDNSKVSGYWFYSSSTISSGSFLGNNTTGEIPYGTMYCVVTFYDSNNNAQGDAIPNTTTIYFNKPESKTCIFIGDSISTGNNYIWKGLLEDYYSLQYVRNITAGGDAHFLETQDSELWPADGGITLIPPVSENQYNAYKSIWYRCANDRMSIYDFDYISLFGGTNDLAETGMVLGDENDTPYLDTTPSRPSTLTFAAALMGCIEMLHRDFPGKPIYLCTVFSCAHGNELDSDNITLSERMALLQMKIADKYYKLDYNVIAVPFYWDMRNSITRINGVFSKDGVHPNYAQAKRMMTIFAESFPLQLQVGSNY